jgi:hypothetical protein
VLEGDVVDDEIDDVRACWLGGVGLKHRGKEATEEEKGISNGEHGMMNYGLFGK